MRKGQPVSSLHVNPVNLPRHVAIIMDGNGRWAHRRGLPRVAGHRAGMKAVKEVTRAADEIGIQVLTLYAFSTENWKRPPEEVDYLMRLPQEFLDRELQELDEHGVRVRLIGETDGLPPHTLRAVEAAMGRTRNNTGLILNFALNYGARAELVNAVRSIARRVQDGELGPEDVDEATISAALQTRDLPDPDLLIRTSGELRISNFLLWQIAYSELWFTEVLWPDFTREHLFEAVRAYQSRKRRFGGVGSLPPSDVHSGQ
ncbi:undecaprenyl diphosphate synthase [Kyrpidia tusciae DSM 2912]|uniref:Isoprenyl transferase n=2 Tax=Kyrpidia TaxID=1129704 RepID=D5WPI2_KYRT2|nr:isoprenyl transferase [Kyrpidia tusciae]ADG06241.1 undecaprenyl diphosphate synthase [Kyrpidia tusciae DSM 2912]